MRVLYRLLLVLALLLAATPASAASRVVLLQPDEPAGELSEALVRLEAELRSEGFAVERLRSEGERPPREALESAAADRQAVAAIAIFHLAGGAAADVWVADRITGKTVIRRVDVADVPVARRPFALALRTVELLRASLVELSAPATRADAPPEVPEPVASLLEPAPTPPLDGFAVALAGAALISVDDIDATAAPILRLSYGGNHGLAARLSWVAPLMAVQLEGALGSASVRQQLMTLQAAFAPSLSGAPVVPLASAGLGFYHLSATGELTPPAVGRSDTVWALAVVFGAGAAWRITNDVAFTLELEALITAPRAKVTMAAVELGSAGRPSLIPSAGLMARF